MLIPSFVVGGIKTVTSLSRGMNANSQPWVNRFMTLRKSIKRDEC